MAPGTTDPGATPQKEQYNADRQSPKGSPYSGFNRDLYVLQKALCLNWCLTYFL